MEFIEEVVAREVLDSRGNPTVEVEVILSDGTSGRATVPSGASTGSAEALELRDGEKERYFGKGVQRAVENVIERIAPEIEGTAVPNQRLIDHTLIHLDATDNKSSLGANAILAVSCAVASASANYLGIPLFQFLGGACANLLPVPLLNLINGGAHANNNLNLQEFLIVPAGFASFSDAIRCASEVYHSLKALLDKKGFSTTVGDEGGFAPNLSSHEEAIQLILEAIQATKYQAGRHIWLGLDCAATAFYDGGFYELALEGKKLTSQELASYYESLIEKYPIISIEDPFAEDDWEAFIGFSARFSDRIQIIGDDLYVTNFARLKKGIELQATNAILIKPNQIGTISETVDAVRLAQASGLRTVVSHRSGETEDTLISHLAVGLSCGQIKSGAPQRGERIAKYNELLRIEEFLGTSATFSGTSSFENFLEHLSPSS